MTTTSTWTRTKEALQAQEQVPQRCWLLLLLFLLLLLLLLLVAFRIPHRFCLPAPISLSAWMESGKGSEGSARGEGRGWENEAAEDSLRRRRRRRKRRQFVIRQKKKRYFLTKLKKKKKRSLTVEREVTTTWRSSRMVFRGRKGKNVWTSDDCRLGASSALADLFFCFLCCCRSSTTLQQHRRVWWQFEMSFERGRSCSDSMSLVEDGVSSSAEKIRRLFQISH